MPRTKAAGSVYYLGRVRYVPGLHSAELGDFLERFAPAGQTEKLAMLQILLDGGGNQALARATAAEDAEAADVIDGLLDSL